MDEFVAVTVGEDRWGNWQLTIAAGDETLHLDYRETLAMLRQTESIVDDMPGAGVEQ